MWRWHGAVLSLPAALLWAPGSPCSPAQKTPPPPPPRTQIVAALLKVPSASLSDVKWEPGHLPRLRSPRPDASLPRALLSLPAPAHSPSPPGSCLSSMPWGFSSSQNGCLFLLFQLHVDGTLPWPHTEVGSVCPVSLLPWMIAFWVSLTR